MAENRKTEQLQSLAGMFLRILASECIREQERETNQICDEYDTKIHRIREFIRNNRQLENWRKAA